VLFSETNVGSFWAAVRFDSNSSCARRASRDLRPGLKQRVHESGRHATAHDRDATKLCRNSRQQPLRKIYTVDRRRLEIVRRPRPHLQIKGVGLARRSSEQNKDHVLRSVQQNGGSAALRTRLSQQIDRGHKTAGDTGACDLKEHSAIDDSIHS
jgi:hypothetical protein